MNRAEINIIRIVQEENFYLEMQNLETGRAVSCRSSLIKLKPVLIGGLLRVGGRLSELNLDFDQKHPVILPKQGHITNIIIMHFHNKLGHLGRMSVLNFIRGKFWVIKGNSTVRRVIDKCIICRKVQGKVIEQEMASLPRDRVEEGRPPFHNTGVDCFGPIHVKRGRSTIKRYGVLFTCLNIRAVHLEVAADLSTDSFINALRRFLSRRGQVKKIRCDQGTNFIGTRNALLKSELGISQSEVNRELINPGIELEFNPPAASHFGGIWERMIRTVRQVLEAVVGMQVLNDDSLNTIFCEIEAIVNSRPLTVVSSDVSDFSAITPYDLLNVGAAPHGYYVHKNAFVTA